MNDLMRADNLLKQLFVLNGDEGLDAIVTALRKARREGMAGEHLKRIAFAAAIEKLAFEMSAPNAYTARFIELCVAARTIEPELAGE